MLFNKRVEYVDSEWTILDEELSEDTGSTGDESSLLEDGGTGVVDLLAAQCPDPSEKSDRKDKSGTIEVPKEKEKSDSAHVDKEGYAHNITEFERTTLLSSKC